MKLNNIDLVRFLPQFMREDDTSLAFINAIEKQLLDVVKDIKHASIYARIDDLDEYLLDILAKQFNITEYNKSHSISVKRNLIKNCMLVHHQRGTVGAILKVVNDVFGEARIEEWFQYGGKPYHFRVYTSNASASDEMLEEFERIIKSTQNCRSYLESATVELYQLMDVYCGGTMTQSTIDNFICE